MCLSLTKTLLYATKDSCLPHLHCKGEARKKECGRQKEGRSAGDSFRRFSRRILSATPGARIRIRTGVAAGSVDFEYAGALGNGKFAAVGLATALPSVIIPCTTHRRLYSFSESVTPLPSFPVHFCSSTMFLLLFQRASRRPWSRRGRRLRSSSRLRVPLLPSSSNPRRLLSIFLSILFKWLSDVGSRIFDKENNPRLMLCKDILKSLIRILWEQKYLYYTMLFFMILIVYKMRHIYLSLFIKT